MINPPRQAPGHPDRLIDLEMTMENEVFGLLGRHKKVPDQAFQELGKRAEAMGWQHFEVSKAMEAIAQNYIRPRGTFG